jgi:hypothetical protein
VVALVTGAVVAGAACDPIAPIAAPGPPVNACPAHPCAAYEQVPAATCATDGVCAAPSESTANMLLLIGLATDGYLAPGRTYVTTLGRATPETGMCAIPNCTPPACQLPQWLTDTNLYLVSPGTALNELGQDIGNTGVNPAIPCQASYRPLLQVGASTADALDLGLPVDIVPSQNVTSPLNPGPLGTPGLQFEAYMEPGCYERTLQPFAPFSQAFPPEVKPWSGQTGPVTVTGFDKTRQETGLETDGTLLVPTFQIERAEGLDGWTAYLRSIANRRVYSNVAPLHGSSISVILATNHLTAGVTDALDGLELVIQPPAGAPLPRQVVPPLGKELPAIEQYQPMPLPVSVSGKLTAADGSPVSGTVTFTAIDLFDRSGATFPNNFEFVTRVSSITGSRTGASTYSALLPQGDYAIAVQPTTDAAAVTLSTRPIGGPTGTTVTADLSLGRVVSVTGTIRVADGRPVGDGIVEALPTACATEAMPPPPDASSTQSVAIGPASDACLPRPAQTLTDDDGRFGLALDPGTYLLRVRPVEGSHLPWVRQTLQIAPGQGPTPLEAITIPAPSRLQMTLSDTNQNPIPNAIVRVFTDPSLAGAAIELGRAITDSTGNYEIDLAPTE